jgi:hypothetical protein
MQLPLIGAALSEAGAHTRNLDFAQPAVCCSKHHIAANLIVHVKQKRMNRSMFKYLEFGSWIY